MHRDEDDRALMVVGVRAGLLVLSGAWGVTLGLSIVLIGAAVWSLPMLGRSETPHQPA